MAENTAREVGRMEDVDGVPVIFGLNLDGTVRVQVSGYLALPGRAAADLDSAKCDEFTRLWFEAMRQAGEWAAQHPEGDGDG